jgi:hypothetical protein
MGIPGKYEPREVWDHWCKLRNQSRNSAVDQASRVRASDRGPCEILPSTEHPAAYNVKFKDCRDEAQEVFVPVAWKYLSIQDALKFADRGKPS